MKETLQTFADSDFPTALGHFFEALEIPVHKGISQPGPLSDFLNTEKVTLNDDIRTQVGDAYLYGIVDENAFQQEEREVEPEELKEDEKEEYDSILLFGIELKRSNPTR